MTKKMYGVGYNPKANAYELWYTDDTENWKIAGRYFCRNEEKEKLVSSTLLEDMSYLYQQGYRPHDKYGTLFEEKAFCNAFIQ